MPSDRTRPPVRTTLHDIAQACGVSRRVVAAALNPGRDDGTVRFAEETRQRIIRTAERLGYRPHRASRTLRSRRHHQIGVLVRDLHMIQEGVLAPLLHRAQAAGLTVVFHLHGPEHGDLPLFVREDLVDGIIAFEDFPDATLAAIDRFAIPLVMVNTFRSGRSGLIDLDEAGAVHEVVAAFAAAGRRRVLAVLAGPQTPYNRVRLAALAAASTAHGMQPPELMAVDPRGEHGLPVDLGPQIRHRVGAALASGCDAFYVQHAAWAAPVYREAEARGRRVPSDVAVACHHLANPEIFSPPLAGLINPREQGIIAVDLLEDLRAGRITDRRPRALPYRFHPGGSIR